MDLGRKYINEMSQESHKVCFGQVAHDYTTARLYFEMTYYLYFEMTYEHLLI